METNKFVEVLKSRKFWALVTSLVAIGGAVYTGSVSPVDAINAAVAALAAYSIGTAIEG